MAGRWLREPDSRIGLFLVADLVVLLEAGGQVIKMEGKKALPGGIPVARTSHLQNEAEVLSGVAGALRPVESLLDRVWETDPEGIFLGSLDGSLIDCNPSACRMFGYAREDMTGLHICDLVPGDMSSSLWEELNCEVAGDVSVDRQMLRRDRSVFPGRVSSCVVTADGKQFRLLYVCDVSEFKEMEKDLRCHAYTDGLTGLWNRYFFERRLLEEMERVRRYGSSLSLIMFDLDRFKEFNDTFGHLCGDRALKRIAELVRSNIRVSDCFARWGGDEFLLFTPVPGLKALAFAERLRREVSAAPWPRENGITLSLGIVEYQEDIPPEILVDRVDRAMYRAKRSGGNRVCAWEGESF